ncbi:hypothetical protein G6F37_000224 [Rhizopus arrhizus]|nr:hypothetical protein G6F38_000564 [Rhizopus arrhizus]KAG1164514.1 hypothetical protein G6F37_000224 [Rhizopus arrhizus]
MSESDQGEQDQVREEESQLTSPNLPEITSPSSSSSLSNFASLLRQPRRDSQANVPNQSLIYSERIDEELCCLLCQNIMKEVFATSCGHSFCYECINEHIQHQNDCPSCRSRLSRSDIYPNFQLNRLADLKTQVLKEGISTFKIDHDPIQELVMNIRSDTSSIATSIANTLSFADIISLLETTLEIKRKMENDEIKIKADLLDTFLVKLKSRNDMTIQNLRLQNRYILSDLDMLISRQPLALTSPSSSSSNTTLQPIRKRKFSDITDLKREGDQQQPEDQCTEEAENEGNNQSMVTRRSRSVYEDADICAQSDDSFSARIDSRFDDLKDLYYSKLSPTFNMDEDERHSVLESFSSSLYDITRYGSLDVLDTLYYAEKTQNTSIVSSIEFDRDEEYFAVGGILKDIKIYDFRLTNRSPDDNQYAMHCPIRRISCENKISCLSWSSYIKSQLASADYQGVINVWDVTTGQKMSSFVEHRKRAWSVDTSPRNPNLLASGSDDTTVKVWSLNSQRSLFTFQHKGNICCAKFAPNNSNYLAVGSADHQILCYDLRYPSIPLYTYQGHQKAVSYVKWLNDNELLSASTDNSLKLWNRESTQCIRTYTGHLNEKNFVGLSVNEDWIACGSETNTVYAYHKYSRTPIAKYKFPMDDISGKMTVENDPTYFVSSVCWKKDTSKLISANSKGIIRVLQLR